MHYIEQYIFALDLYLNSLNHVTWQRLKVTVCGLLQLSRHANTWFDHDYVSICLHCALLAPQWKANLRSTSVQAMNTWPLGYSITRLESQNRKFAPILIITGPKNDNFFVCKQTGFVNQRLWDFEKWLWLESLIMTRVESFCEKRDSSRVRVTKNRDSSRVKSLTRVTLSLLDSSFHRFPGAQIFIYKRLLISSSRNSFHE